MSSPRLVETTTRLIKNFVQANIALALQEVSQDRPDQKVSTEPFKSYFIYPNAKGYQAPCCFVLANEIDFRTTEKQANYISASVRTYVVAIVEDRREDELTVKSWRYQAALYGLLDQLQLTDTDEKVKLVCIVKRSDFSRIETTGNGSGTGFRREIVLDLEVEHWESRP